MQRMHWCQCGVAIKAPPKKKDETSEDETNKPECWICLDDGPDENGGMPRRDCSCRGDAGFAHLMCLQVCKDNSLKETDSICESKTEVIMSCIWYASYFYCLHTGEFSFHSLLFTGVCQSEKGSEFGSEYRESVEVSRPFPFKPWL